MTLIRMKHLRAAGVCNRESRLFFMQQGWSWQDFLDHGVEVEKARATGHAIAMRVADIAVQDDEQR